MIQVSTLFSTPPMVRVRCPSVHAMLHYGTLWSVRAEVEWPTRSAKREGGLIGAERCRWPLYAGGRRTTDAATLRQLGGVKPRRLIH